MSTVRILRQASPEQAKRLLSATRVLLPDPGLEPAHEQATDPQVSQLLAEVRQKLDVHEDTPEGRSTILAYLANELSDYIYLRGDRQASRARIGQEGWLSPELYTLKFSQAFENRLAGLGVRKAHIEAVVQGPELYQPLHAVSGSNPTGITFFANRVDADDADPFWLLVEASRKADQLTVQTASRVYSSDVGLTRSPVVPTDLLRAFTSTYGFGIKLFEWPDAREGTLFLYEPIPIPAGHSRESVIQDLATERHFHGDTYWRAAFTITPGAVEVLVVYCVDVARYRADLQRHGVFTAWEPQPA